MSFLNYHHLRYFWVIAHERSLTKAAQRLNLAPSAVSIQLKQLEENLGQRLFDRQHKTLVLTEAGQVALDYADTIFRAGEEMLDTLAHRSPGRRQYLRVGAVSTLSRNFTLELLRPAIDQPELELIIRSGTLRELLAQLEAHNLDLVLANSPVLRDAGHDWKSHLLAEQAVSLVGQPTKGRQPRFQFPKDLEGRPLLLPSLASNVRTSFDTILERAGVRPVIVAEIDDMAMLRLLARESHALALVPRVVVQDELREGVLRERIRIPEIQESFYAITPQRRFPNAITRDLVESFRSQQPTSSRGKEPE